MRLSQEDRLLMKGVSRQAGLIVLLILACKLTHGLALSLLVLYGVQAAMTQRLGRALSCYVLFPFFLVMNPFIASVGGAGMLILRLGFMAMTGLLVIASAQRTGQEKVPFGMLWVYLFCAIPSSICGYAPLISFMKLINFAFFLVGITLGIRNLDKRPRDLQQLHTFLLAITTVLIVGSACTIPFPGVACFTSYAQGYRGFEMSSAEAAMLGTNALFCGITDHSQTMAPLGVVALIWVLCDMLFVERRMSVLHLGLLGLGLLLLYKTRSRSALLALGVGLMMVQFYCFSKLPVAAATKRALRSGMLTVFFLIGLVAIIAQVKDGAITKWVFKWGTAEERQSSVMEAVTHSRMGLIEENLADFRRNPLLGSGFQVAYEFQFMNQGGKLLLSAPIEKGVLPVMVLGEGGLLGALAFVAFLGSFYLICGSRGYVVTATLFTTMMATNMGEATFFSTGGCGGILWVVGVIGGFAIDMLVKHRKKMAKSFMAHEAYMRTVR